MAESSKLKDLIAFLGSVKGDLANITSPPNLLAPQSVTEISSAWTERPSVFVAPALEADPQKRAFLVTKWILTSLKSQYNVGGGAKSGIKKPLNAFLGEVFLGKWTENGVTSRITTEQVSHHPPVTASYLWNNEYGIRGEGYTRVEMTFDGSVNIKQNGHAMVHIDRFDEDYLIPVPDAKVRGFLSGKLHLELNGTYHIVSSTGFVTEIRFTGSEKGIFSSNTGDKNTFEADLYHRNDTKKTPLYTVRGQWDGTFEFRDCASNTTIETWDSEHVSAATLQIADIEAQDPWESRRAWQQVLAALRDGNMSATIAEKSKIEEAQRAMRKVEEANGHAWSPHFFSQRETDPLFQKLGSAVAWELHPEKTAGIWMADRTEAENPVPPFHGGQSNPLG